MKLIIILLSISLFVGCTNLEDWEPAIDELPELGIAESDWTVEELLESAGDPDIIIPVDSETNTYIYRYKSVKMVPQGAFWKKDNLLYPVNMLWSRDTIDYLVVDGIVKETNFHGL